MLKNKPLMINLIKTAGLVVFVALMLGVVFPILLSAKSTIAVVLGAILILATVVAALYSVLKNFVFSN